MAGSQPVASKQVEAGSGKEAEADREKHDIEHFQSLRKAPGYRLSPRIEAGKQSPISGERDCVSLIQHL
jgi:hypothetical protein